MKRFVFSLFIAISLEQVYCQKKDSILTKELLPVTIEAEKERLDLGRLAPISGAYIVSGKKNEVIHLNYLDANISDKIPRQVFSKVAGLFVYDLEGSNQTSISTRGLDPHRGWEFNQRKDGIIVNSDLYAYPASHYSIPWESVERIEYVRGTSSLQYGSQLGGMLNYITKNADTTKPLSFENYTTVGSFNLLSSYNAFSGKIKKFSYYVYYIKRTRDGYRENEHTDYDAQGAKFSFDFSSKLSLIVDWVRSYYLYKIPGPLNDEMFRNNPRQATRFRNYFNPEINIQSITLKWKTAKNTNVYLTSSALLGQRRSVIYDRPATVKDSIVPSTLQYNRRVVDIDSYNSFSQELKLIQKYKLFNSENALVAGCQLINNLMNRRQLGKGTTGTNYSLALTDPIWGRNLNYKTNNFAFFIENMFEINSFIKVNIGTRWELGESNLYGQIVYYPDEQIPTKIKRNFPLLGGSISIIPLRNTELYGGFSQAYRGMLFKDLVPSSIYEKVDPNIKDADGYNAEFGYRGNLSFINWDITAFVLQFNNRFGTLVKTNDNGEFYTYRTNIGNSTTKGIEMLIQGKIKLSENNCIIIFTSTSLMDGRYTSGSIKSGNQNVELKGKKIESVPEIISRNGITLKFKKLSFTSLVSYTSKSFADPINTENPNPTGTIGIVPEYTIVDANLTFELTENMKIKAGLNNILDRQYFTKRPVFYPGPGIWPSDGRNGTVSLIVKI